MQNSPTDGKQKRCSLEQKRDNCCVFGHEILMLNGFPRRGWLGDCEAPIVATAFALI
jgi:hypothetical protein